MSRARPIKLPDGTFLLREDGKPWFFDMNRNGEKATAAQVELLATVLEIDLDDLLDEVLTQGDVIRRLREAFGGEVIPPEVLQRREAWRQNRQEQPRCRMCEKEGDSTKHHFVNKWILKELDSYERLWADRSKNCIPLCIDCHRDLHFRGNGSQPAIAEHLTDDERDFAQRAIQAFADQHPRVFILVASGDECVYEAKLLRDWLSGGFRVGVAAPEVVRVAA